MCVLWRFAIGSVHSVEDHFWFRKSSQIITQIGNQVPRHPNIVAAPKSISRGKPEKCPSAHPYTRNTATPKPEIITQIGNQLPRPPCIKAELETLPRQKTKKCPHTSVPKKSHTTPQHCSVHVHGTLQHIQKGQSLIYHWIMER